MAAPVSAELDPAVHRFNKIEWRVPDGTMIHLTSMIRQSRDWGRSSWLKGQPGAAADNRRLAQSGGCCLSAASVFLRLDLHVAPDYLDTCACYSPHCWCSAASGAAELRPNLPARLFTQPGNDSVDSVDSGGGNRTSAPQALCVIRVFDQIFQPAFNERSEDGPDLSTSCRTSTRDKRNEMANLFASVTQRAKARST